MLNNVSVFLGLIFCFLGLSSNAQKDWQVSSTSDGITLWTKEMAGSTVKQFKLKTTVKGDLKKVYEILRDVEHMSLWYDRIDKVQLLKKTSDNEGIYLLEFGLPFPFENRIATITGKISYDTAKETITVKTQHHPYKIPENKKSLVQINEIGSTWEVTKTSTGDLEIIHAGHMNPGGNIPLWIVNDGVTSGPIKTIKSLKKILATP